MKNTHRCTKCGSDQIVRVDGYSGAYGSGNHISTGITMFNAVNVNRYVCCQCGFVEEWVDEKDLPKLKKKYDV